MRRLSSVGVLLVVCLLLPALALAQETTGSISGTVVQQSGGAAVPQARITVTSDRGSREVVADAQGRFLLAFLTPGSYDLSVAADGFQTISDKGIAVGLGQRISRRYELSPTLEESMDVTAPTEREQSPIIDLTVQSSGASIPTEIAEQLPLGRNISSVVFLAPGVKSGGGTGAANPSISGSSGLENQYVIDGVNVTNGGYGALGAYSIIHGSQGTGINFNFVEETQVITGGFAAEYGQAMGGIVNIVTKSGTNDWKGSLFGYWTPDSLEASRITPDLESFDIGKTLGVDRLDYGGDIGGPIVKDHVFFWVGLNPTNLSTTRRAPYRDRDGDGVSDYALYDEGELVRHDDTINWAAKLSFQINPDHRIDFSAFGDPTETNNTYTRGSTTLMSDSKEQFSSIDFGYKNYTLKYQGQVTPNFLVDLQVARAQNEFNEAFAPQFDANRVSDLVPLQTGTGPTGITGGIGYFEDNQSTNDQYSGKFTSIVGKHELRYGFAVESVDYDAITDRTGTSYTTRNGDTTTTGASVQRRLDCGLDPADPQVLETELTNVCDDTQPARAVAVIYRVVRGLLSDPVKATHSGYTSMFLQDDWSITPNFHLNYGVRWEKQSIEGSAIKYTFPGEFSPRVGFSWDHTGTGSAKLYAHVGRFYEKVPLDMAVRIFSPEVGISRDDHYDVSLTRPVAQGANGTTTTRYLEQTSAVSGVVPGTRNSYMDELSMGYQHALGAQERWTAKGELQFRKLGRILEDFDVSVDSSVCDELEAGTRQIEAWGDVAPLLRPAADQLFGSAVDCGYLLANMRGAPVTGGVTDGEIVNPERKYKAAVFELTRQADERWYLKFQYVLSRIEGNYEGLYRNDNDQSDPNLTSLYDFPNEPAFYDTYKSGPLNTDRTHRFQVFGFYNWSNGWSLNSRASIQTGVPKLGLAAHPIYENAGEIQTSPRGSLGRTPTEWTLDFGIAKRFKLKTSYDSTVTLSLDIFNLLNHTYGATFDFDIDSGTDLDDSDYPSFVTSVVNGIPNPDYGKAKTYSAPRALRFGAKWTF